MFAITHTDIKKAIIRSQHCQRNWDLSKEIPQEDLDLLITAATQCPSKQNVAYYKIHAITNRELIEAVHGQTDGFRFSPTQTTTNTQVLANLLIVLEKYNQIENVHRNDEWDQIKSQNANRYVLETIERDRNMAVGVAAGYLNMVATLLGYNTGCCACFYANGVKEVLQLENEPILLMGIGFKDDNLNRRVHHVDHSFIFPSKEKQPIPVNIIS